MKKKILGVIPARGGSKGIPKKNIKDLCGKPLIQYIFETATKAKFLDKIILSTDDDEIYNIANKLGIETPFLRPKEFATDNASSIMPLRHAYEYYRNMGINYDGVLSLQATNPFTTAKTIDEMIQIFDRDECDSVTTISEVDSPHPYITKRLKNNGSIENFCIIPEGAQVHRRQLRETAYFLIGGLYLRSTNLICQDKADSHYLGIKSKAVVVNKKEALDINSLFDFKLVEWVMKEGIEL